jgi:hypothetical protein
MSDSFDRLRITLGEALVVAALIALTAATALYGPLISFSQPYAADISVVEEQGTVIDEGPDERVDNRNRTGAEYQNATVRVTRAEGPTGTGADHQLRVLVESLNDDDHVVVRPTVWRNDVDSFVGAGVFHSVPVDDLDDEVIVYSVDLDREQVTVHYRGRLGDLPDVTEQYHEGGGQS